MRLASPPSWRILEEEKSMKNQAHRPIVVKGPYPTPEEVAAILGLSRRETRELDEIMEAYFKQEGLIAKPNKRSSGRPAAKVRRRGQ
jgi:hypothetical protein